MSIDYTKQQAKKFYAKQLIVQGEFVNVVIRDMQTYLKHVGQLWGRGEITNLNWRTYQHSGAYMFDHQKNLRSRLKRIKCMLKHAEE